MAAVALGRRRHSHSHSNAYSPWRSLRAQMPPVRSRWLSMYEGGEKERGKKKKRQPRPRAKQFISLAIVDMIDSLRTHAPSACACVCTLQSNDTCNSPRRRQLWRLALVLYQACCVACRAVPYGWMSYYVYSSLDVSGLIIPGGGDKRPYAIGSVCSLLYNPSSPSARCCFLGLAAVCWRKRCTLSSAKPCAQIYGPCKWVCLFR